MATIQEMQRAYQAAARPTPRRAGGWGVAGGMGSGIAAKTKPPTTAPSGVVTDAPIPGVSAYGAVMARAQDAYNQAAIASRANKVRTLSSLGFDENGAVQGQNLYGAYQQNRRAGGMEQEAITASGANRGIGLYGGLADQQREQANYGTGVGLANVLGQANAANAQAAGEVQSADQTLQDRLAQAQLDAAQTNIESRNYTTAPEPKASAAGIKWAGQTVTSKAQLTAILAKSGVKYATWAKTHAAAAAKLK